MTSLTTFSIPPPVRGLAFGKKVVVLTPVVSSTQIPQVFSLSSLSLTTNQFPVGATVGTIIGTIEGVTGGSILLLTNSNAGAVQLSEGVLQVGVTPPGSIGTFNVQITEVLSSAVNSPYTTTLTISETSLLVPINLTVPIISGTVQVGQTLIVTNVGTWTNNATAYAYQWNDGGVPISGATASSYVLMSGDVGDLITCSVTAFNGVGRSVPAPSAALGPIIDLIPTIATPPAIPGVPQIGSPVTAIDATWNNSVTSSAYQWKVGGVNAAGAGATTLTYTPVVGDLGQTLSLTVTPTNTGGTGAPSTSAASGAVIDVIPTNSIAPTITGTTTVGQLLTAHSLLTDWANRALSLTFQWNRAGTPIGSATSSTYTPVTADAGNTLTVSVVATNSGGSSSPATSAATSSIIDLIPTINTAASIPGIPQVGIPITSIDATWNNSVTSRAYQWKVAGVNATGVGATMQTYTPVIGDVGSTLTVTVTATNTGGSSAPSTSAASAAVVSSGVGGKLDFTQAIDSPLITLIAA
jgi:hypothetical protein